MFACLTGKSPSLHCLHFPDINDVEHLLFIYLFFSRLFAIPWESPMAYGGSQARGLIGAVATYARATATWDPSRVCYTTAHGNARSLTR